MRISDLTMGTRQVQSGVATASVFPRRGLVIRAQPKAHDEKSVRRGYQTTLINRDSRGAFVRCDAFRAVVQLVAERLDISCQRKPQSMKPLPSRAKQTSRSRRNRNAPPPKNVETFPIVAIGASAGGLEATGQLLSHLPHNSGMAFVLVQHLSAKSASALPQLLARMTKIPVSAIKDGVRVKADQVYVIPPNNDLVIMDGVLHLVAREPERPHLPIDHFFSSLAEDAGNRAIGVILSGTGSDGTRGIAAIKAADGLAFAQDEKSAKYADMPKNAAASGMVDFVLPPERIANELLRTSRHPYLRHPTVIEPDEMVQPDSALGKIFTLLRAQSGVDFSGYKQSTIGRRIKRRMVVHHVQSLSAYVKMLEGNRAELEALYHDILIHVTGFFRDPELFDALKTTVFPNLLKNRGPGTPVRIWIPGCSTGEEVYSLAISLLEVLSNTPNGFEIQIFGTDISEPALERARAGVYPENIASEVSSERLRRFFIKTSRGYQISKRIREMCVFARQDVVHDPPFSRLDLISCRNVLIYLGATLQQKVLPIFHYALKSTGYLLLGGSETVGSFTEYFSLADKRHKIYAKKPLHTRLPVEILPAGIHADRHATGPRMESAPETLDLQKQVDRVLLSKYVPASVLINSNLDILQFRGRTGLFLEPSPGRASLNLLKMAKEELVVELGTAVHKAKKERIPVQRRGVLLQHDGHSGEVEIEVVPIKGGSDSDVYFLVLFREAALPPESKPGAGRKGEQAAGRKAEQREITRLKSELSQTRSTLQSIIEQQETTTEELKSSNEEVLSSNEELQSTNEELETAKEELQSANEELTTLNEELHNRNEELSTANNDLLNLLSSANIPILMLGNDLRIRRFTPQAERLLNLIPTDVGRPVADIKPNFDLADFDQVVADAIDTFSVREREVQDRQGRWLSLRVRPYKTAENKIDGAVVTWVDINALKVSLEQVAQYAQAIVETSRECLVVLDRDLRIKTANATFYETFQALPQNTENHLLYEVGGGVWNIPRLRTLLEEILPKDTSVVDFDVELEFTRIGTRRMLLNARQIRLNPASTLILLSIEDVTDRQPAADGRKYSAAELAVFPAYNLVGVFRAMSTGRILDCNKAFARILGYDSAAALMRDGAPAVFSDRPEWKALVARLRSQSTPALVQFRLFRRNGTPVTVLMNTTQANSHRGAASVIDGVVLDITDRKEAEAAPQVSGRLLEQQDKERREISRELHDTTSSSLTALVANLARIKKSTKGLPVQARKSLDESLELARQCSQEIRTVSYLLHPPMLDELGLASALRWYVDGFRKRSKVRVSLNVPVSLGRLPREVETAVFRIVQEGLTNIQMHSGSPTAKIRLKQDQNIVTLEVSDHGSAAAKRGERTKFQPGVGIAGMRERVKQLGGMLDISSTNPGTKLTAKIPLDGTRINPGDGSDD